MYIKQILICVALMLITACKQETKNSEAVQQLEDKITEMERKMETLHKQGEYIDSLLVKHEYGPRVTIIDEKYSSNPFDLEEPLLKKLFNSPYSSVDTTFFNNRHVDNQVDTVFTFNFDESFIEIYKNPSEEFVMRGFSNSSAIQLNGNLRCGMRKTDFLKLLSKTDSISNLNNIFRIQNPEVLQSVNYKFTNNKLEFVHFEGYSD